MGKQITIFGSFAADLMSRTPHLPAPGETVKGSLFQMGAGGKGFNQGIAARKAGGEVVMITKLGRDAFAQLATGTMERLGMDTSHLLWSETAGTGTALILVDENTSQNEIVIVPGACETISAEEVAASEPMLAASEYVVFQLEINQDAIDAAARLAHKHGAKIILNPAPARPLSDELLSLVDIITPNEVEAEGLTGIPVDSEESAVKAAKVFFEKGVQQVVITLGGRGVFISSNGEHRILPRYEVEAIDTTGAGDAFNGALAAALAEGKDIWEAARFANAYAALSVTKLGTSASMPDRAEVDAFLASRK